MADSTALKLLWILFCLSVVNCYPNSQIHFKHGDETNSILHKNVHSRKRESFTINFQEIPKGVKVSGDPAGGIRFPTDDERDSEVRSRIPTLNETPTDQNLLPPQPAYTVPREETSAEILESFLKWARSQGTPVHVIATFNSTRRLQEGRPLPEKPSVEIPAVPESAGVGWALGVGSDLRCPRNEIRGPDGVCRPSVSFSED